MKILDMLNLKSDTDILIDYSSTYLNGKAYTVKELKVKHINDDNEYEYWNNEKTDISKKGGNDLLYYVPSCAIRSYKLSDEVEKLLKLRGDKDGK